MKKKCFLHYTVCSRLVKKLIDVSIHCSENYIHTWTATKIPWSVFLAPAVCHHWLKWREFNLSVYCTQDRFWPTARHGPIQPDPQIGPVFVKLITFLFRHQVSLNFSYSKTKRWSEFLKVWKLWKKNIF